MGKPPRDPRVWRVHPEDEVEYERFVKEVMRQANQLFYSALHAPTRSRITNAVIDFTSSTEESPVLCGQSLGAAPAGWNDPDCRRIGAASREARDSVLLQEQPFEAHLRHRELTLATLDCPTLPRGRRRNFFHRVILPMIHLPKEIDHLYGWLWVMCRFCRGKPLVYVSRYVPGPLARRIATHYRVRLLHLPIGILPPRLLERNRTFRQFRLTREQWGAVSSSPFRLASVGRKAMGVRSERVIPRDLHERTARRLDQAEVEAYPRRARQRGRISQ